MEVAKEYAEGPSAPGSFSMQKTVTTPVIEYAPKKAI
jgi:hypothetical protein